MRISYLLIAVCLLFFCAGDLHAQGNKMGVFTWNWSYPASDTKTYTDNDSWLGASLEGQYFPKADNLSIGVNFGWNEFYNTTYETINFGDDRWGGAISGRQYRHLAMYPMLATGHFYMGGKESTRPYFGLGAGAYYIRQLADIGIYTIETDSWHFGLMPEVGVLIPMSGGGYGKRASISVRYHYPFEGGEYIGGSKSFQYFTAAVGFSWESY